ncbi:NUDIX domain-containing protein [Streptomyces sp. CA-111067]|uniref:NUDIX domain-containing protein n=1 Tax=Streptomyces sp. CA-111067 TaxID=3240046 RepID=UPI003D984766
MTATPPGSTAHSWPPCPHGAKALLRDHLGRLVLVKPRYNDRRHYLVGGALEPGEDFEHALTREVWEETGLHRHPGRLLVVVQVPADEGRGKPAGLDLIFDVEPLAPGEAETIRLPPDELSDVQFIAFDDIDAWTLPPLARTIRAAHRALVQGVTALLPPYLST